MVIKFISFNSKSTIIAEVQLVLHEFQQKVYQEFVPNLAMMKLVSDVPSCVHTM